MTIYWQAYIQLYKNDLIKKIVNLELNFNILKYKLFLLPAWHLDNSFTNYIRCTFYRHFLLIYMKYILWYILCLKHIYEIRLDIMIIICAYSKKINTQPCLTTTKRERWLKTFLKLVCITQPSKYYCIYSVIWTHEIG